MVKSARRRVVFALTALVLSAAGAGGVRADEGMWTFDNPPLAQLSAKYGFTPTTEWLDHLRLSSVRFNDGGSGSFVSPRGLVLTNHHVALGQLQKVSTSQKNYVADGFFAKSASEELKCPDLELNVLVSMENVTARVQSAAPPTATAARALEQRKKAIAAVEEESTKATGLRSDVVELYQSSEYWLYRYKKYTDVRLVFAPEQPIAFFGGDPDNFTYPRYDFDVALFRVYENGAAVTSRDYLKWSANGAADGELVFVSGHPGATDRLGTVAQLETERDLIFPVSIDVINRRIAVLRKYSGLGTEQARQAAGTLFSLENALKANRGEYAGLLDVKLMEKKRKEEREFRARIEANREWKTLYGDAWDAIAAAEKVNRSLYKASRFQQLRGSSLAGLATSLVRYIDEKQKPDADRLNGYHDAQLQGLELQLFSPAPVYPALDEALLADALQQSFEELGPKDPFNLAVLKNRTAAAVAKEALEGTTLADPAARKALAASGSAGLTASTDPLVVLARSADVYARKNQKLVEDRVASVETAAGEKVGRARFAVYGHTAYPDATFTLRLSYGQVKGYPMNGTLAPPKTTLYGLYERSAAFDNKDPFELPRRYTARRASLDLSTPMNFVSSNDIIGGNSGSPVVNRAGEFVGIIFDGNIESLVGRFVYSEDTNRAVAVHSAVILEALRKLYDAGSLADELTGRGR
ncbi:MAG: S46 family peptidase [Acidobacteriota bacterium]